MLLSFALGATLGGSVLVLLSKAVPAVVAGFGLIAMGLYPELAYYALLVSIPIQVEVIGNLTVSKLIVPAVVAVTILNAISRRCPWPNPLRWPNGRWALVYFAFAAASVLYASETRAAIDEIVPLVYTTILFYFTLTFVSDLAAFRRVISVLFLIGVGEAVITLAQIKTGFVFEGEWRSTGYEYASEFESFRAEGTTVHPVNLGSFFMVAISFSVGMFVFQRRPLVRAVLLVGIGLMFLAGYYTYSRTLLAGLAVMGITALMICTSATRRLAIVLVCVGVFIFLLDRLEPGWVMRAPTSLTVLLSGSEDIALDPGASSLRFRFESWVVALKMFANNPILGVGLGQALGQYEAYTPVWATYPGNNNIHNVFLEVLAELGLFAFIAFCALWVAAYRALFASTADPTLRPYAKLMLTVITGQFAFVLVTPSVREIWLTLALALALGFMGSKSRERYPEATTRRTTPADAAAQSTGQRR